MDDQGTAYVPLPRLEEAKVIGARAVPLHHVQRRFLYAGRILVAAGWLVCTYTIGNPAANAEHTLVGLTLLLLGVSLIMLSPVANRFPGAARAGAAVADTVIFYFFAQLLGGQVSISVRTSYSLLYQGK